jgi:glycosyltransferase involved in cell wall biosynthesis
MACGTPVIAMRQGSAPEVIVDGKTGFLCNDVEDCIAAVAKVADLNRQDCRWHVEAKFSPQHMVEGYEAVYRQVVADRIRSNGHRPSPALMGAPERVA